MEITGTSKNSDMILRGFTGSAASRGRVSERKEEEERSN